MKTAYLYVRVSTDEQADKGYSLRYQDETLHRWCTLNNVQIKATFIEDHSAKNFNRPEFTKLLVSLKKSKGVVDLVLFTKWDRFSRNAGDAYQMISTLNKLGVEPQAIEQPLNLEIPENKMMLAFYLAAPEVENDRRSLNIIGGMRRARKEGRVMGKAPMGYMNKVVDGKKTIAPNPGQAEIMKWAFTEIAKGVLTVRSVMQLCKEKGLITNSGRPVCKASFWASLRNPVYFGKIRINAYKGEEELLAPGTHQPLISADLFYQVQDVLAGKKKVMRTKIKVDEKFPLRGFLLCPQCGKLLTASSSKGRHQHYHYYHCFAGCNVRFKNDLVHGSFEKELSRWKPHPAVGQLYKLVLQDYRKQGEKLRNKELNVIKEELSQLEEYKSRIRKMRINGDLDTEDYNLEKKECEEKIDRLTSKLAALTSDVDIEKELDLIYNGLSNIDEEYKKRSIEWQRDFVGSMFPEKLQFDGVGFRTAKVNEVAQAIFSLGAAFNENKKGQVKEISNLSYYVDPLVHFSNRFVHDLRKLAALFTTTKAA